jgi:HTH-type transcriptional regulator/antitoxin HigA
MAVTKTDRVKDDYLDLIRTCPLRKIRDDAEHARAVAASGKLIGLRRKLTAGEALYLDALVVLIREYERRQHDSQIPQASAIDVLRHLMAEHSMSQRDLAAVLGIGDSAASMILSGDRELTKSHIQALAARFGVGAGAFFQT